MTPIRMLLVLVSLIGSSQCILYWEPVFVAYAGNNETTFDRWNASQSSPCTLSNGCLNSSVNLAALSHQSKHLKSQLVDSWENNRITEVRVELLNNRTRNVEVWMEFNGRKTNKFSWFTASRLIKSNYDDLFPDGCFNSFSIIGHGGRKFYVNQKHGGGCPGEIGWMNIVDSNTHNCPWDVQTPIPQFLFAPADHKTRYRRERGYGRANVFVIYIKRDT